MRIGLWIAIASLGAVAPHLASAQPSVSGLATVRYAPSYRWRGRVASERMLIAPSLSARVGRGASALSGGIWTAVETRAAPLSALTLLPATEHGVAQVDLWAAASTRVLRWDVGAGIVRYGRRHSASRGQYEAYGELSPSVPEVPLDLRISVFTALTAEHATYAEVEATHSFSLLPLPAGPWTLLAGVTSGFSLRPDTLPANPAAFARAGPTHTQLSLEAILPLGRPGVRAGVFHLIPYRPITDLATGNDQPRTWGEVALSYQFGKQPEIR
jgi:hypothetical protein